MSSSSIEQPEIEIEIDFEVMWTYLELRSAPPTRASGVSFRAVISFGEDLLSVIELHKTGSTGACKEINHHGGKCKMSRRMQ